MGNQLLFESRRTRGWIAKAAAVLGVGLVVSGPVLFSLFTVPGRLATEGCIIEITTSDASLYLASLLVVVGAPSMLLYRRRDVP